MKTTSFLIPIHTRDNSILPVVTSILLVLLTASCDGEQFAPSPFAGGGREVHFIASAYPQRTRATTGSRWQVDHCIGVYMIETGKMLRMNTIVDGKKNIPYRVYKVNADGEALLEPLHPMAGINFPAHGQVHFIAYYPYEASIGDDFLLQAGKQDQSGSPAPDLLYSNDKISYAGGSGNVLLRFGHQMSKLTFAVSRSGSDVPPLDSLSMDLKNVRAAVGFDLSTGFMPDGMGNGVVKAHITHASADLVNAEVLLPPAADTNRIEMNFLVSDSVQYHIPLRRDNDPAFLAGCHYAYRVTLYGR